MNDFPPVLEAFLTLIASQPDTQRETLQYCLYLLMIEAGKMRLVETIPGEDNPIHIVETAAGMQYSVVKPEMDEGQEKKLTQVLRNFLTAEGIL